MVQLHACIPQIFLVLWHNSLTWFSLYKLCTGWPYLTCHFKSPLSSGRTSTEKSTGLLVGINEISPRLLTSPAPMKIPERLWTLSTSLFLRKGIGNIPYFHELNKCNSFFFTVINKCKKSGKKGLSLTLLQLLFRKLFSLDGGTKPLSGISLEVSSFPQRRKCTSQITYNFFVRQSDVRTPSRVLAMTAPWDSYYNQPELKAQPLPHAFIRGFGSGLWQAVDTEYHSAMSSLNLLQTRVCHSHPDGGTVECSMLLCFHVSVFLQLEKNYDTEWDGTCHSLILADKQNVSWIRIST